MKGLVIKLIGGRYSVLNLETKEITTILARGKLRYVKLNKESNFNKSNTRSKKTGTKTIKLSPKVGDYVIYDSSNIIDVLERKNELIRPDCANIDQVLLVFSAKSPDMNFLLLDQFLVLIEHEMIKPVIIITKIDLLTIEELETLKVKMNYYHKIGYEIIYTSLKSEIGLDKIKSIIGNKINILAGQTGAGKSSLMNKLDSNLTLKTDEISKALGRGKHTTRHTELYFILNGMIADTPGFSKLDFENWDEKELKDYFIEFKEMSNECKFRTCSHINEPNCKVKEKYQNEEILKSRYLNYLSIYQEIKDKKVKY